MHILALAARLQARTLQQAAGVPIELRSGGAKYAGATGVLTTREYVVFDADGMPFKKKFSDWIISLGDIERCSDVSELDLLKPGDDIEIGTGVRWDTSKAIGHLSRRRFVICPIGQRHAVEPLDDLGIMVTVHSEEMERNT